MSIIKEISIFKIFSSRKPRKGSPVATVLKSSASWSSFAEMRLWNELHSRDHVPYVTSRLVLPENVFEWEATIIGPANCAFENGVFAVSIHLPTEFPFKPPHIKFKTKIFHPNINESGDISIDILGSQWTPAWTVHMILFAICSILSSPVEPFLASNPAVKLYQEDRETYQKIAREWTLKYAKA